MDEDNNEQENKEDKENNPEEKGEVNLIEKTKNQEEYQDDDEEPIEVEVEDRGINTDELPPEELQRLVDNNIELKEVNEVSNIDHEIRDKEKEKKELKKQLIDELNEKDKIFELLVKANNQLKNKIELSNKKYQEILNKIETKKKEDMEHKLNLQIKELDKSIKANNSETERYKKMIDQLKTKIEFKENLERASSIQYILKQESLKNNDLQNELNALKRINKAQEKYIENFNKENQVNEKLEMLKEEIKQNKEAIKDYQDKYNRLEKFIRLSHEKILSLEMCIKKVKEPKEAKSNRLCRICYGEEENDENPLLQPCTCSGSMKYIHLNCLKTWINTSVNIKLESSEYCNIYSYKPAECELCKTTFPDFVRHKGKL